MNFDNLYFLQTQKYIILLEMNPDYTSDIRLVDRFIFESSLYLLTMFEKKIDSFTPVTNMKQKMGKIKQKQALNNSKKPINPELLIQDPIQNLAKDKTKPIWDCITTFRPRINCHKPSMTQQNKTIYTISQIFQRFFNRYKNQHEDESNLRVQIDSHDFNEEILSLKWSTVSPDCHFLIEINTILKGLFKILIKYAYSQLERMSTMIEDERIQQESSDKLLYKATIELLQAYEQESLPNFSAQLSIYNRIIIKTFFQILDTNIASSVVALQPKLSFFPLLIHPMLTSIYVLLQYQVNQMNKKQEQKMNKKHQGNRHEIYRDNKENQQVSKQYIFGDLKTESCSHFVFINFDGYESQYNVDLAKYMSKNIMYVSFPKQSTNKNKQSPLFYAEMAKSQRLLRKYFYGGLNSEQKQNLLSMYKEADKQTRKNLYMFPIHCKFLSQNYPMQSIQGYQSAFITFIMKQLIYNQILQFNPSCIIVSYSGKLKIHNQQFTEIMKELTVLGNYKVTLNINLSKNYMYEEPIPNKFDISRLYVEKQSQYFQAYQKHLKILPASINGEINVEIMQKISIAIKVISGTYNLSKVFEGESYVQKYKNFKSMSYASDLANIISNDCFNLSKWKMRLVQYSTVMRVLANSYKNKSDTYDKLFGKTLTKYHHTLLKLLEKYVTGEENNDNLADLIKIIHQKYDEVERKELFDSIKFQYSLQLATQKTQTHIFAYIPKYKTKQPANYLNKSSQNLLSLEFQIIIDRQKISTVQIAPYTSVYYSETRKHQNAMIYMINHLPKINTTQYGNFYGYITPIFDEKMEPRIQLRPFTFEGIGPLPFYQTFTEFNYFETRQYLFLFWPKLFDSAKQFLHRMAGTTYIPETTSLIFRATRSQPHIMRLMTIQNPQIYQDILPRHGCTCFEMQQTKTVYIFGGFYSNDKNYLKFQTDISIMKYDAASVAMINVPKNFYFDYSMKLPNSDQFVIDAIKNDMIRPKIQYEIIDHEEKDGKRSIFLVGGIGQNFIRPYSLISHMAHRVVFDIETGNLVSVQRIPTNNVIPVNVRQPVKTRSPLNLGIITNAQNRSINLVQGNIGLTGEVLSRNKITYSQQEEKFNFTTQYEFGQIQRKAYREEVSFLKKAMIDTQNKSGLNVKNTRGKDYNAHYITLTTDNDKKYILELQLQLSLEVRNENPQLLPVERLTGSSIISIDINGTFIFALIRHPILTYDQCILAMFDISQLSNKIIENKTSGIQLRQIHKFDDNVSQNILIAGNSMMIAVIHGQRFESDVQVPQLLLIRTKKNQIKTFKVRHNKQDFHESLSIKIPGGINSSLFLNKKDGVILCFSFKTIMKKSQKQQIFLVIQRFNMKEDQYYWETIFKSEFALIIKTDFLNKRRDNLRLVEISTLKKESANPLAPDYDIIALYDDKCFRAKINFKNHNGSLEFYPENKTSDEYFNEIYRGSDKQHSILLEKHSYLYSELNHGHILDQQ